MKRRIGRLFKRHRNCGTRGPDEACACAWKGRYRHHEVTLAKWLDQAVDPRDRRKAEKTLAQLVAAVEAGTFSQGTLPRDVAGLTLSDLLEEWTSAHAEKHQLTSTSLTPMLNVIKAGIGAHRLSALVEDPRIIERWLDAASTTRKWKPVTWNKYHGLLFAICEKATSWRIAKRAWLPRNPIADIETRVARKPNHFKIRVEEPIESKLFAVVDQLNRIQHGPTRAKLTQEKADQIRAQVAAGEAQAAVARRFDISTGLCCQIIKGDIWNPAKYRVGTKGAEMYRRLVCAFDGGLRRAEMQLLQIKHITWKPTTFTAADGTVITAYPITLPPDLTKGGKSSGEDEVIYAATDRFRQMLDRRRLQLKNKPEGYICGTEQGSYQRDFDRMWQALFDLAGLDWGRQVGVVWHSIRHEYISRIAELTGDPVLTKELARHKRLETTELYMKAREQRKLAAVAGLSR